MQSKLQGSGPYGNEAEFPIDEAPDYGENTINYRADGGHGRSGRVGHQGSLTSPISLGLGRSGPQMVSTTDRMTSSLTAYDVMEPPTMGGTAIGAARGMGLAAGLYNGGNDVNFAARSHRYAAASSQPSDAFSGGSGSHDETTDMPAAPYQALMQNARREDTSSERFRSLTANQSSETERLPAPEAGAPRASTLRASEPTILSSRLSRHILNNKPERKPDLVVAKVAHGLTPLGVKCPSTPSCGTILEIPRSAVLMSCPVCHDVHIVATCQAIAATAGSSDP
jgi:hypothetical protein